MNEVADKVAKKLGLEIIDVHVPTDRKRSTIRGRNGTFHIREVTAWAAGSMAIIQGISAKRGVRLNGGVVIAREEMDDLAIGWLKARGILGHRHVVVVDVYGDRDVLVTVMVGDESGKLDVIKLLNKWLELDGRNARGALREGEEWFDVSEWLRRQGCMIVPHSVLSLECLE